MYMSIIVICHWNVISSNALWGIGSCQYMYVCICRSRRKLSPPSIGRNCVN